MQALQIVEPGRFEIKDVSMPQPGPNEVLMKVLAVTTCPHWDLHIFGGQPMFPGMELNYPYTLGQPGHEACGEIAAVGPGVTGFKTGQRVCAWRDAGHDRAGCYAQYVLMEIANVIPVPAVLPPESCAPLELAMCVSAHAMFAEKLDAIAGHRVGVFGLGPAGLVFVQLLRIAGAAEIVGFDPLPARRELARTLGADLVLDPAGKEAAQFPQRGHRDGLHAAFDCVGTPGVVHQAMAVTSHLVVLFAVQREPYIFPPQCWPGLTLAGTQPHTRAAAEYALERLADGRLDLGALVTDVMPLREYSRGVALLKQQQAIKVAFQPHT
jgi:threonine dehydrogenase-like Zn-dependent dehydrogenase